MAAPADTPSAVTEEEAYQAAVARVRAAADARQAAAGALAVAVEELNDAYAALDVLSARRAQAGA